MSALYRAVVLTLLLIPATIYVVWASEKEEAGHMPASQLKKEHDITLKLLDAAQDEALRMRRSGKVDARRLLGMHDFFSNFVDRCHHAKEERFYFPAAKHYGGGDIQALTEELSDEHDYGRALLQEIAYMLRSGGEPDPLLVADRLDRYAELIRAHIGKENEYLYRRSDIVLPPAEKAGMLEGFPRIEKQELGEGFHRKYHDLAMGLLGTKDQ